MITKEYFDTLLREQVLRIGSARGSIVLHNGTEFKICKIEGAHDTFVLAEVFPARGCTDAELSKRKRFGSNEVFHDRVAIPYSSICYVWLSRTDPERESEEVGFHAIKV